MFSELDDRNPLPASVPEQRAATIARARQLRRTRRSLVAVACITPVLLSGLFFALPRPLASAAGRYRSVVRGDVSRLPSGTAGTALRGAGGCSIGWPCLPLVAYHIPTPAGPGSGPPTMGRLAAAPSRIAVVTVPYALETLEIVIWLWDVRTSGATTDEVLRAVTPILDTLRFETPSPLAVTN